VPVYAEFETHRALIRDEVRTDVATLREHYLEGHPALHKLSDESRLIVSEPLGDLAGAWNEVPESICAVVQAGEDELRPFAPRAPV
jgi:hypothetical protein